MSQHLTNLTITGFNFDHPDAFDNDLLCEHLRALKEGKPICMPQYDFVHHRGREDTVAVEPGGPAFLVKPPTGHYTRR